MSDSAAAPSAVGSSHPHKSHSLFQVYLRLRPPPAGAPSNERFITVEPPAAGAPSTAPTHINLSPPTERRRPIEKFAFTHVFDEDATQLDVFHCTNVVSLVEGVLAPHGREGTDALLATLGVTGSGKVCGICMPPTRIHNLTDAFQTSPTQFSARAHSVA